MLYISYILYDEIGFFKDIFHNKLNYHSPIESNIKKIDDDTLESICKYCGKHIENKPRISIKWYERN